MRLVEEEDHAGLVQIAHFGQLLKELRHHPQQEGGVGLGALDQALGGEDVDVAAAVEPGAHPVVDIQLRLSKEALAALFLEGQERALDGADAGGGDVAVHGGKLRPVLAHELQHGPQILQVQQQQTVLVRHTEDDVENAGLDLGQVQETTQKRRPHLGHGDAHGNALLAEDIPEAGGIGLILPVLNAEALNAALHILAVHTGTAHAAEIALHVRQEHGDAHIGEGLRHHLQGDGLAGAGGAGDEAVAVGHGGKQEQILVGLRKPDLVFAEHMDTPCYQILFLFIVFGTIFAHFIIAQLLSKHNRKFWRRSRIWQSMYRKGLVETGKL